MTYFAYGYLVQSNFILYPCQCIFTKKKPDIVVKSKNQISSRFKKLLHTQRYQNGKLYSRFYKILDGYMVYLPSVGKFSIKKGGRLIICKFNNSLNHNEKVIGLICHVLPLAASLRGEIILHAATIIVGNKAQLIVGPAGVGKSTIAHYMHKAGYAVFSDDSIRIKLFRSGFKVAISSPFIRVFKSKTSKSIFELALQSKKWAHVNALYLPNLKKEKFNYFRMKPIDAMEQILAQLFRLDVKSEKLVLKELSTLSELSTQVPIYSISYDHTRSALLRLRNTLVRLSKSA